MINILYPYHNHHYEQKKQKQKSHYCCWMSIIIALGTLSCARNFQIQRFALFREILQCCIINMFIFWFIFSLYNPWDSFFQMSAVNYLSLEDTNHHFPLGMISLAGKHLIHFLSSINMNWGPFIIWNIFKWLVNMAYLILIQYCRFTRNANLVASGVARNIRRVGNSIKETVDDIVYPYRKPPK